MARKRTSSIETLLRDHVLITENCWIWTGALKEKGYGQVNFNGKNRRAHKLFYEHFKGPVPDGLVLDHLCRVRRCVNPDHLEAVTNKVNSERGYFATKPSCPKGHPYSGDNLRVAKNGNRFCITCKKESDKRYNQKVKLRLVS